MAKKSRKIEKETRRLIEGVSDLVKKKGDRYKFRTGKKKQIRRVKKTCVHWIIRKGKETPTVVPNPEREGFWLCTVCQEVFPIRPSEEAIYMKLIDDMIANVNQLQFYSVKMGGDSEDTKVFIQLKQLLPRYKKIQRNLLKQVNKRQRWEERKNDSDAMAQFSAYSGFAYRPK